MQAQKVSQISEGVQSHKTKWCHFIGVREAAICKVADSEETAGN